MLYMIRELPTKVNNKLENNKYVLNKYRVKL